MGKFIAWLVLGMAAMLVIIVAGIVGEVKAQVAATGATIKLTCKSDGSIDVKVDKLNP